VTLQADAAAGELDVTIRDIAALTAQLSVLVCVAFGRPPGTAPRTGKLRLKRLTVDGVDLPVADELAGDFTGEAAGAYAFAAQTPHSLTVPVPGGPVNAPYK
jgi:hypothetical protein